MIGYYFCYFIFIHQLQRINQCEVVGSGKTFHSVRRTNLLFDSLRQNNNSTTKNKQQNTELTVSADVENPLTPINSRLMQYFASLIVNNKLYAGAKTYIDYTIVRLGLKPLADVMPLRPEFGMVVNDVTAFKYPIEIAKCRKETIVNRTLFW